MVLDLYSFLLHSYIAKIIHQALATLYGWILCRPVQVFLHNMYLAYSYAFISYPTSESCCIFAKSANIQKQNSHLSIREILCLFSIYGFETQQRRADFAKYLTFLITVTAKYRHIICSNNRSKQQ